MFSRNLTVNDSESIDLLIDQHSRMYGVPFSKDDIKERIKKHYLGSNHRVIGVFDNDEVIGMCTQFFWGNFPIWSLSNLFIRSSANTILNEKMIKISGFLLDQGIKNAEEQERFEFYYLCRDTKTKNRIQMGYDVISKSSPSVAKRYDFQIVHRISSPEDIKWKYVDWLLGDIGRAAVSPPYNKSLFVRKATIKPEFRKI